LLSHFQVFGITLHLFGRQSPFVRQFAPLSDDLGPRQRRCAGLAVVQKHLAARLGGQLCNAPSHGTGANNGHVLINYFHL